MKLTGDQLKVTQLTEKHVRLLLRHRLDFFREFNIPYEKSWPSNAISIALPLYYDQLLKKEQSNLFGPCMIQLLLTNQIIGEFNLKQIDHCIEIGYHIFPRHRNNGYATEALKLVCKYIDQIKEIDLIRAYCYKNNKISLHILKKIGFQIKIIEDVITLERGKEA
ncbi:hypothetical protein Pryu01_00010 [Paraliobacillus ryukyuensis]|uniref:RimJ/RimL family protein N-acetyltransferase n=1 Tax=Paraliobacillus ryukyuensis TaxID=200904 RepID=A0A366EHT7_9BACI|nr:GNAT family N-acetyltransferase [Paraliobacillus ryukyuensis]RBP01918.1 RimJ/RimL family protein N-acetyltransferase [Paraliobacillus ryukyuensis]